MKFHVSIQLFRNSHLFARLLTHTEQTFTLIVYMKNVFRHNLVIFNQITFGKKFKVSVLVNDPRVLVTDESGPIIAQILPVYNISGWNIDYFKFKVCISSLTRIYT